MKREKISIRHYLFTALLVWFGNGCLSVFAQNDFDTYFEKKSLRIDFALSGDAQQQTAALQQLREEPVWGGPRKNLIDPFEYGGYCLKVYDQSTGKLIYSRGFCTLFEEWRTTVQATKETQSWTNSVSIPYPKKPVVMELLARDRTDNVFSPLMT
ncbi:MAG: peptidase M64, partial [Tannerella sp.]|nr:peptidase M64 [Tannerella sp.]